MKDLHVKKMQERKEIRDKISATKTEEKGLLIVHTGKGKGKSTAAFGMVFRALAHGMRVGIVQFSKGSRQSGERIALEKFSNQIDLFAFGEGFTWETQDRQRDVALAEKAWSRAKIMILDESFSMVLCDELNIVLRYGYLSLEDVLQTLQKRCFMKHVIVTGRNAAKELIDIADLVTEMKLVKHHFYSGIKWQKGIEF